MLCSPSVSVDAMLIAMAGVFTALARTETIINTSESLARTAPHKALALIGPGVGTNHARIARPLGKESTRLQFEAQYSRRVLDRQVRYRACVN